MMSSRLKQRGAARRAVGTENDLKQRDAAHRAASPIP